jgi:ATP-binding cassette subfamily B protein
MKNLKILYKLLINWKWQFLSSSILLVIGMFFRTLEPKVFQILIDTFIPFFKSNGEEGVFKTDLFSNGVQFLIPITEGKYTAGVYLLFLGLVYFGISAIKGGIVFSAKTINASATEQSIKALRDKIFDHIQKLPMQFFSDSKTGELTQRATGDIDTIRNFVSTQMVEIIRLLAVFIFSFFMIYSYNKWFAWISISLVPITAIASYLFFQKEQKVWRLHEDESDKLNNATQENLSGIRVVQAFANEEHEIEKFEKQNQAKLDIALKHARLHTFYWPLSDMIVNAQIFISVIVGAWFTVNGSLTIGQFMSSYAYVMMVAFPMRQVSRLLSQMGMALVAVERIDEVFHAKEEDLSGMELKEKLKGKIEFKNVSFKYKGTDKFVVKDVSFVINPGETISILGPTGAGKSTLMKLLLLFYEPNEGEIFIDDMPLSNISKTSIREKIGIVLQKAFLFSDTIGNNISYTQSTKINILETANLSGLTNIESVFVNGMDTVVGEKGVSLSGGQKQRVALARTLLSNPDVLVLDDVTSAVDTVTEKEILKNLKKLASERTTLNITHRLSSLSFADKIMILEDGVLTGFGLTDVLMESNSYFSKVMKIQSNLEVDM